MKTALIWRGCLAAMLGVCLVLTQTAGAGIVPNRVGGGRFIRVNKTKPNNLDTYFHVGEIQALLGKGLDWAVSGKGATGSTVYGVGGHGTAANLVSDGADTSSRTWTRDDQQTSPGVFEVEALVDLGQTRNIQSIQVLQRGDNCCQNRLQDFTVTLEADDGSGSPGAVLATHYFPGTAPGITTIDLAPGQTIQPGGAGAVGTEQAGRIGRFVMVQNNGLTGRRLHTSEIEAFAPGVTPNNNSAPSTNDITPTSFQSEMGTAGHGSANSVFDGNLETGGSTWTREGIANAYILDLGSTQEVETIRLWQRADSCCQERLENFTVSILSDNGSGEPGGLMGSQNHPGRVTPTNSYDDVTFANAFTIDGDDTLEIDIDPVSGLTDVLQIGPGGTGALTIAPGATLDVNLLSFAPGTFDLLDAASISGQFDTINLPAVPFDLHWDTSNLHTTGELTLAVPEPATCALSAVALAALGGYVRRRRKA